MRQDLARDREFLLPASTMFIVMSFFIAVLLEWMPWRGWMLALRPDFVGLVLL